MKEGLVAVSDLVFEEPTTKLGGSIFEEPTMLFGKQPSHTPPESRATEVVKHQSPMDRLREAIRRRQDRRWRKLEN